MTMLRDERSPEPVIPYWHPELERLICRAVSEEWFAQLLVASPAAALERAGHAARLSPAEQALVTSITGAIDIYDFAARLHAALRQSDTRVSTAAGAVVGSLA
jgi:hypothetical protein